MKLSVRGPPVALLEVHHVTISYQMKRMQTPFVAVRAVDFHVQPGEIVAIIGPSGCGKTSLLNAVAGIVPVQRGQLLLQGRKIAGPGRGCAMVFQTPALLPWRTVARNVAYGLELQGVPAREARQQAQDYIDLTGLQGFEESYPHELSGGMQQRANLARALAVRPQVLLFDEPLAALDAQTREVMQVELQRIWLHDRTTTLYVTHQISEAVFLADRVVVLSRSPGTVKSILTIDLPRPRTLYRQRPPAFVQLEDQLWDLMDTPAGLTHPAGSNNA